MPFRPPRPQRGCKKGVPPTRATRLAGRNFRARGGGPSSCNESKKTAQLVPRGPRTQKFVCGLAHCSPADQVYHGEQDNCAEQRPQERFDRQTLVNVALAEQQSSDDRADDADDDVKNDALLSVGSHNEARKPADDSAD